MTLIFKCQKYSKRAKYSTHEAHILVCFAADQSFSRYKDVNIGNAPNDLRMTLNI